MSCLRKNGMRMKRLPLSVSLALLFWLAAPADLAGAGDIPSHRVVSTDDQGLVLEILVPPARLEPAAGRVLVRIPGYGATQVPGEPELPLRSFRVAIPEGARPVLSLLDADTVPLGHATPQAVPRILVPNGPDGVGGGEAITERNESLVIYRAAARWPASPVRLGEPGSLSGVPFVNLVVTPVSWKPGRQGGRLEMKTRLTVRIDWGDSALLVPASAGAAADLRLGRAFVNPAQARGDSRPAGLSTDAASTAGPDASGNSTSASLRYKLTVRQDGIYRLDYAWVAANAPDILTDPASRYRIMNLGVEIPITVFDMDGDGTFENNGAQPDDYIEFTGQKLSWDILAPDLWEHGDWTDDNIYWLDAATVPGLRITTRNGNPVNGYPQPADFSETIHHEVNDTFIQTVPVDGLEHWHQKPGVVAVGSGSSQTFSVSIPDASAATTQASIKVKLLGDAFVSYHRSNILVNNLVVDGCGDGAAGCGNQGGGCVDWDGFIEFTHGATNGTVNFCQNTLTPATDVKVELPLGRVVGGNPVTGDTAYLDWVEISYGRQFKVVSDALVFRYPNQNARFQITGLSTNSAAVYEITNTISGQQSWAPVRITNGSFSGAGPFNFTFESAFNASFPAMRTYIVAVPTASTTTGDLVPAAVAVYTPTDILAPVQGADWMVITDTDLLDTAPASGLQQLISFRQSQGKRVKTVLVGSIYDEFSFGVFDPQAIKDFLTYAWANWPQGPGGARLADVVFLGDASFDTKNNYGNTGKRTWVPTYVRSAVANTIIGYYSDDVYFARVSGPDEMPDIRLGRLPVHTMAEANIVAQRIKDYELQSTAPAWQRNVLLTAENTTSDFKRVAEDMRVAYLAGTSYTYNRIYQLDLEPLFVGNPAGLAAEVRDRFQRNLNGQVDVSRDIGSGAAFATFIGHGSWQTWGKNATIMQTNSTGVDDITPLTNFDRLPFLFISNCLSGGFHVTAGPASTNLQYAFAEDFVTTTGKGAIASLAPAHLTFLQNLDIEVNAVFNEVFGPRKERMTGEIAMALREEMDAVGDVVDLRSYALLADPAMKLVMPAPAPPANVTATAGDRQVALLWSSAGAASYSVYRSTSAAIGYVRVANNLPGTAFTDTNLANCTPYYYQVVSVDAGGFEGRRSHFNTTCPAAPDCLSATPLKTTAPVAPTGLVAVDAESGGRLDVSWTPSPVSQEALYYTVRWSPTPNNPNPPGQQVVYSPSYAITSLTNGQPVYVSVSATNCSQGEGPRSPEAIGVPNLVLGIRPPLWVTDLKLSRFPDADGTDDIKLQWTLPGVDIYNKPTTLTSVKVYHNTSGPQFLLDPAHLLVTLAASATSYIHENAFEDVPKHYYLVVLTDTSGYTSGGGHNLPRGISDMTATKLSSSQIRLSWSPIMLDLSGLLNPAKIYRLYSSSSVFSRAGTTTMTPQTSQAGTVITLAMPPDTIRYYFVLSEDARGNPSPW